MANKKNPPIFKELNPDDVVFNEISPDDVVFNEVSPDDVSLSKKEPESLSGAALLGTTRATKKGTEYLGGKTLESIADFIEGAQHGAVPGWGEEIEGALGARLKFPKSKEEYEKLYKEGKQKSKQELEEAKERSPIATGAGEIAGAVIPSLLLALATKGKTIKVPEEGSKSFIDAITKSAKAGFIPGAVGGAVSGLGESEVDLLNADKEDIKTAVKDTLYGAAGGGVMGSATSALFGGGSHLLGKMGNWMKDSESAYLSLKDNKTARELKKLGVNYEKEAVKDKLINDADSHAFKMTQGILQAENKIGNEIVDAVEKSAGKDIEMNSDFMQKLQQIKEVIGPNPKTENRKVISDIIDYIEDTGMSDSSDLYTLRKGLKTMISHLDFKEDEGLYELLDKSQRSIRDDYLNKFVPGFSEANKKFEAFKDAVPDTIYNRGYELTMPIFDEKTQKKINIRLGKYSSKDSDYAANLLDHIRNDIRYAGRMGSSSDEARNTFVGVNKNLEQFAKEHLNPTNAPDFDWKGALKTNLGIDFDTFAGETKKQIDILGLLQRHHGFDTGYGSPNMGARGLKELLIPREVTSRSGFSGRVVGSTINFKENMTDNLKKTAQAMGATGPGEVVKKISTFGTDQLYKVSDIISDLFPSHSAALKDALSKNNSVKRNAVIFALSQNPDFRNIVPYILTEVGKGEATEETEGGQNE